MAKLILAVRYVAFFALAVAVLLIITRAKFPVQDQSQGTLAYLSDLWRRLRERRADHKERAADMEALRGKTALVVDPDDKSTRVMSWRLEAWNCSMLSASKGNGALRLAKANGVDFVVVDALLSDISAQDFYHTLGRQDIPVIFVGVMENQYDELRRLGQNTRCFGKPFDPDEVLSLAGYLLRSRIEM